MEVEVLDHGYITVPAGRFEVFYIKARGAYGGALAQEVWYSPEVRNAVKSVGYFPNGKIVSELVSFGVKSRVVEKREVELTEAQRKAMRFCTELGFTEASPQYTECVSKAEKM